MSCASAGWPTASARQGSLAVVADGVLALYDVIEDRWETILLPDDVADSESETRAVTWFAAKVVVGARVDGRATFASYDPETGGGSPCPTHRSTVSPWFSALRSPVSGTGVGPASSPGRRDDRTGPIEAITWWDGRVWRQGPPPLTDDRLELPWFVELDGEPVAVGATIGNPGGGPFRVAVPREGSWWVAEAPFGNRMEPGIAGLGGRLAVVGGAEGPQLSERADVWFLLPGED